MKKPSITIGIVTHDRPHLVINLIKLLSLQIKTDDRIVIIENGCKSGDFYQDKNVYHFKVKEKSIPKARNSIIKIAQMLKTEILVFIDDDCIPSFHWLEEIRTFFKNNTDCEILQGNTVGIPRGNTYAMVSHKLYQIWFAANSTKLTTKILDTKNSSFRLQSFLKRKQFFNENLSFATDIELGYRLVEKGAVIYRLQTGYIEHIERSSFMKFVKHRARTSRAFQIINKKYPNYFSTAHYSDKFKNIFFETKLSFLDKLKIFAALTLAYSFSFFQQFRQSYVY